MVGAALGVLLAPKSGAETRRDVARYAKKAQLQATRFSRSVKTGVSTMVERSQSSGEERRSQRSRLAAGEKGAGRIQCLALVCPRSGQAGA